MFVRYLVAACICAAGPELRAQGDSPIHSGAWIIGGSGSLRQSHDNSTNIDRTIASVSPSAIRFLNAHLAVGGTLALSYSGDPASSTWGYGLGPAARYYIAGAKSTFLPFVAAAVLPSWQHTTRTSTSPGPSGSTTTTATIDSRFILFDGSVGLTSMLATNVGITGEAFFDRTSSRTESSLNSSSVSTTATSQSADYGLRVGLSVFIH